MTSGTSSVSKPAVSRLARSLRLGAVVLASLAVASGLHAQDAAVHGVVIDAETERPIVGAVVSIQRVTAAAAIALPDARSDARGRYRFIALAPGRYRLNLRALGYHPAELSVEIDESTEQLLSIGLSVMPVRLQRVEVSAEGGSLFARTTPRADAARSQRRAEELTRERLLTSDARAITETDVRDAVTVGEADLFRSIRRLPGIGARDDYTSALWVRGAPWDQTQVAFDGVPLFNPLHGAGLMSGISSDALDAVTVHPGIQPTASASTAAGLVEMTSRRGSSAGKPRLLTELTLLTARASVDQSLAGGRARYMLAARRSHIDLVAPTLSLIGKQRDRVPYTFSDAVGRLDVSLPRGSSLSVSAFGTRDRLSGNIPGIVQETRAGWSSLAAQATVFSTVAGHGLSGSVGVSRASVDASVTDAFSLTFLPGFVRNECCFSPLSEGYVAQPMNNGLRYLFAAARIDRRDSAGRESYSAGMRVADVGSFYATEGAWPHATAPRRSLRSENKSTLAAVWAERTVRMGDVTIRPGVRVEGGSQVTGLPPIRVGPRATLAYSPSRLARFSLGAGRTFQYWQTLAPRGHGANAIATSDLFWVVGDEKAPGIQSDMAVLGAELFAGAGISASATLYARQSRGLTVSSPDSGALPGRALFVTGGNAARGFEAVVRRTGGLLSGALSYTRGRSTLSAASKTFAAPWDRRAMYRATAVISRGGVRLSSQYSLETGAPYTTYYSGTPSCLGGRCAWVVPPSAGSVAAGRLGTYRSLDLGADWQGGPAERFGAFVQGTNVLRARNPATYLGSAGSCAPGTTLCNPAAGKWAFTKDDFLHALPAMFAAGVRVIF